MSYVYPRQCHAVLPVVVALCEQAAKCAVTHTGFPIGEPAKARRTR